MDLSVIRKPKPATKVIRILKKSGSASLKFEFIFFGEESGNASSTERMVPVPGFTNA